MALCRPEWEAWEAWEEWEWEMKTTKKAIWTTLKNKRSLKAVRKNRGRRLNPNDVETV